jgi:hypothetical protein
MFPEFDYFTSRIRQLIRRLRTQLRDDAGYSTETVIVTALLAAAALAAVGIIVAKVRAKAGSISL